jgi:hypothetical protein
MSQEQNKDFMISQTCPKCGSRVVEGYGLMGGGGPGCYWYCEKEECEFFHKELDKDE